MPLLTRGQILAPRDLPVTEVAVPEWGGNVRVRRMTLAEREEFRRRAAALDSGKAKDAVGAWLVATLAVGDDGNPLFTEEDAAALAKLDFAPLDRVVDAILAVNRVDDANVERAEKN